MGVLGTAKVLSPGDLRHSEKPRWAQLEIRTRNYPTLGDHWAIGLETDFLLSTRKLLPTYSASITAAPDFTPTPASGNAFRPRFRANSFLGAGIVPVYKLNSSLSARIGAYGFLPLRSIVELPGDAVRYGRYLHDPQLMAEADISFSLPIGGVINGYLNYSTTPGDRWNVGVSFGIYILPPKFLR